jgi:hypothetical protein
MPVSGDTLLRLIRATPIERVSLRCWPWLVPLDSGRS